ncbi:MAG: CDGSH iron-sulfur domain-containing protein [Candidatus Eisenbacteria bacterium]
MTDPKIADSTPALVDLEPGTYWWCACGRSNKQPFCDGFHKGTGFTPRKIEIKEMKRLALCRCKHTGDPPLCDGTQRTLG